MSTRNIRSILYRMVPVAVPVWLWGLEVRSQDLRTWTVDLDDSTHNMLSDQAALSAEQCYALCGTEAVVRCALHPTSGTLQLDCVGPPNPNGFHNGTGGCSCGQETTAPKPPDLSKPRDLATPTYDLTPYMECTTSDAGTGSDMGPVTTCRLITPTAPGPSYPPGYRPPSSSSNQCGRRPLGLHGESVSDAACTPEALIGQHLAAQAHLEAASVVAFRQLERHLRHHGAPSELIKSARRATRDEIRHARTLRRFSADYRATIADVRVRQPDEVSLLDLALANACEGCVGETYGAAVARFQSVQAADPALREAMATIAEEETQHAELAFALDDWLRTRLSAAELRALDAASQAAIAELHSQATQPVPSALVETLGIPDAAQAAFILRTLRAEAWV
jgi:hypothetical protein